MKVILAGFSKCGTKTMAAAFRELGYNNYDFLECFEHQHAEWMRIFEEGGGVEDFRRMFAGVDSCTDLPCCFFWEQIHQAYPDAKIILTQRKDDDEWWRSFKSQLESADSFQMKLMRLLSPTNRAMAYFVQRMFVEVSGFRVQWRAGKGKTRANETIMKMTYRKHNSYVLANAPKDKLLVFDLRQGWGPLCEFLGEPVPSGVPFPHNNKNASLSKELMDTNPLFQRMKRECLFSLTLGGAVSSYLAYKLLTCDKTPLYDVVSNFTSRFL